MTTISTSSLSTYSSAYSVTIKKDDAATTAASSDETTATGEATSTDSTKVAAGGAPAGGGAAGSSTSDATQESIEKLQEQIEQTEKQLQQQDQQPAAAQNGSGTPEEKAQKAMAIQAQISGTNATLSSQQAALVQLQTSGGIDTTA